MDGNAKREAFARNENFELRNNKMSYSLLKQNSVKRIKSKTIYAFF